MTPGDAEWTRLITASKVAAILGVSPWESPRSVWHHMHGDLERPESNEVQRRGHYLEPAILAWWRDQHPECVGWTDQPDYRLGDWAAATPDLAAHMCDAGGCNTDDPDGCTEVLVEAKSAAYDDDWGDPGTDQIPTYYLTQVYFAMEVSGIHRTYVPIITSRLRFAEYVVDHDPEIGADLVQRMRAFYDTLAANEPPPLDDTVATFDVMRKLHPDIDADLTAECTEDEARALIAAASDLKEAEARDRAQRSWAIDRMGRARFLTANGVKVARRQPNAHGVSFVPLPQNLPLLTAMENAS